MASVKKRLKQYQLNCNCFSRFNNTVISDNRLQLYLHILILISVFGTFVDAQSSDSCLQQVGTCACKTDKGYINLEPLDAAITTGLPKFTDVQSMEGIAEFSYNPCTSFSTKSCSNVAVCAVAPGVSVDIGIQKTVRFAHRSTPSGSATVLEYTAENSRYTTDIILNCDPNIEGDLVCNRPVQDLLFTLQLTTKYACSDIAPAPGGDLPAKSKLISPGDVILIVFALTVIFYFTFGVAYNKFHKGATGMELLPNVDFWKHLPGLIRDGGKFIWYKISSINLRNRSTYEEV